MTGIQTIAILVWNLMTMVLLQRLNARLKRFEVRIMARFDGMGSRFDSWDHRFDILLRKLSI